MTLAPTLGRIRSTLPRTPGSNPISTFSALLADVKGEGLLGRTRGFYLSLFATLLVALGGAVTGFMARPHLAPARRMVRQACARQGIPYTETSLARAYQQVIAYMNRMGRFAGASFECPVAVEYRRS